MSRLGPTLYCLTAGFTVINRALIVYDNHQQRKHEMSLYKQLSPEEEVAYRQWARDNYSPGDEVCGVWHPVVKDECGLINNEAGVSNGKNPAKK